MDTKELAALAKSHRFVTVLTLIGFLIIAIVIFEAGVAVGFRKASFAAHWEANYRQNFGSPRRMVVLPGMLPSPSGAFGSIESVSLPTFVVVSAGEPEKVVRVGDDTLIRAASGDGSTTDLAPGKTVTVVGRPGDDGTVDAFFIRILPQSPSNP
jgi:hypothetical protein